MTTFKTLKPSTLDRDAFVHAFADIYEHSPWVAEKAYDLGQLDELDNVHALHQRMSDILLSAPHADQLALINAHPDLAGKAAVQGELTASSTNEQAGAGIHQCTAEEFARFTSLNEAYKAKFQFPFIMAVKGSDRHQILASFEQRIHNDAKAEFAEALKQINQIALFRLQQL
ncbi:2-oxo-4-hydroxy-4-carboxy-5-ureidoimidazoline decarboxylase [Pseudomonas fulva]|jgi:OHCU decarboxylase|uniref:2-oxo-4-hydroxy-4-carboxy-5-ureidoimidazoline decarboxylase n=1 Tax=Pseudomonas fulva TaxID=47880 RepID=A0A2V4K0R3_9PSED|nr:MULTISPECIES: 2-oxo-4-hydroxy-4-carboxy-5-ureidoimidazoline decarboxylase [Pseudomonas]MDP9665608.1 OHCU decarboxylase [Pseudomonas cremoricolorata]HCP28563.1 2-oxo-4-hydroxy-4-carboxy-5-ureidoimidazoline decarboxylase [Pseudomonas sp.]MDH0617879.1 2-oxo-4-hydroxy-4-carboxy-5-ureidoimidazoline decarboxylase [Pseudomonas fulva]PYB86874.1 2-oxo-4-hydroxy-4-carboxy-5-ureidoimidazoline decarboxylase [Pseudomonas fulva]PYC10844.1 2-oxo-4-hydroxy-4-carboxy-5-ureidoimidazoline decarboxylase [Pseud